MTTWWEKIKLHIAPFPLGLLVVSMFVALGGVDEADNDDYEKTISEKVSAADDENESNEEEVDATEEIDTATEEIVIATATEEDDTKV